MVALPRTEGEIILAARALDLIIPPACMPGVVGNLTLLASHVAILADRTPRDGR